jgi:uncharacterized protein (DUF885 family)
VNPGFDRLVDEFLELLWRASPSSATALGEHRHDGRLVDCDPAAIEGRGAAMLRLREALSRLRAGAALDPEDDLDAEVMDMETEVYARLATEVRVPFRDPNYYFDEILNGLYFLLQRDFAPLEVRLASTVARLREVPRLLAQGKANLSDPAEVPDAWVASFLERAPAGASFLVETGRQLSPQAGRQTADLDAALAAAAAALDDFEGHVRATLAGRARGSFAIGRELFEFLLRRSHGVESGAGELAAWGETLARQTRGRLEEAARTIDPGRTWQELVEDWKADHPPAERLLGEYSRAIDRAREFVRSARLATLPAGDEFRVVPTPPFHRAMSPFAAYLQAAPFERRSEGQLWITPPDDDASPGERDRALREHLRPAIEPVIAHEVYPGHHLQLTVASRLPSRVRRVCGTPVFVEGWAFYCEHLMAETGFYEDPRSRVLQLRDQVWRACRVVIDVGLQTGTMDVAAAAAMLAEAVRMEPKNARREVMRYVRHPTQPLSYAVGKEEILKLREEVRRRRGAAFTLGAFHDALLSYGSIPLALIRDRLLAPTGRPASR